MRKLLICLFVMLGLFTVGCTEFSGDENNLNNQQSNMGVNVDSNTGTISDSEETSFSSGDSLEYEREGDNIQTIKAVDKNGKTITSLSIDKFNERTNSDERDEIDGLQIGPREIQPKSFSGFDELVDLSPDGRKFIFSVSDYFAATTKTLVGIYDIKNESFDVFKSTIRGSIEEVKWSENSDYVAFTQGSARAQGDYLTVGDIENMQLTLKLSGEKLLENSDKYNKNTHSENFMPNFSNVEWKEGGKFIIFSTVDVGTDISEIEQGNSENIRWEIGVNGEDLRKIE